MFIGTDSRQPVAAMVLAHSINRRASKPVSITFLNLDQLPITRRGLTEFTYSRYLVPWLCNYEGEALFLDADMLCLTDICDIYNAVARRPGVLCGYGVNVVKDGVEPFEWPSLMYFNCTYGNYTPEFIDDPKSKPMALDQVFGNAGVGEIHKDWNHIVPYSPPNPNAKIVHFTQGIPCWEETRNCEYGDEWIAEFQSMCSSVSFEELMGNSIHKQRMAR